MRGVLAGAGVGVDTVALALLPFGMTEQCRLAGPSVTLPCARARHGWRAEQL